MPPAWENTRGLATHRGESDRCGLLHVSRPPDLAELDRQEIGLRRLFLQEYGVPRAIQRTGCRRYPHPVRPADPAPPAWLTGEPDGTVEHFADHLQQISTAHRLSIFLPGPGRAGEVARRCRRG